MDQHNEETEYLITYGLNTSCSFNSAIVTVYYDKISFANENNLRFYKSDNYNFTGRICLTGYNDITGTSTKDAVNDYFQTTVIVSQDFL